MYQKSSPAEPGFWEDERGLGLQDSPFMVLIAVILIGFVTFIGIGIASNLMTLQKHASAVDAAEKIYNAADLLSAGTEGSSRTLWISVPAGYKIEFLNGDIELKDSEDRIVGRRLHINGVDIEGENLAAAKHHLKLELDTGPTKTEVTITELE